MAQISLLSHQLHRDRLFEASPICSLLIHPVFSFQNLTDVSSSFIRAQSCPTLCHPMGSPVRGIIPARILDWTAMTFLSCDHCLFPAARLVYAFFIFSWFWGRGFRVGEDIKRYVYTLHGRLNKKPSLKMFWFCVTKIEQNHCYQRDVTCCWPIWLE